MVKFFDINASSDGKDKDDSHPKDEPQKEDDKKEHEEKPKADHTDKPEVKEGSEPKTEPLRPDFSVGEPKADDADKAEKAEEKEKLAEPELPKASAKEIEATDESADEVMSQAPDIPRATAAMAPKEPEQHSPLSSTSFSQTSSTKKQRLVTAALSTILIILMALLVSQAVIYFTQTKRDAAVSVPKADTTPKTTTKSTTADASTTPTDKTTTTDATATTAPASTALTKDKATVRILNGSGVTGAANKASALIKAAGYTISSTGNAKSYTYATTQVLYKNSDAKSVAEDIAKALTGYTTEVKEDAATPASATEIVVVVGKK